MLDPFSLCPFASFQLPGCHDLKTFLFTPTNLLLASGQTSLLVFELDQEIKRQQSLFADRSHSMYEEIRASFVQPDSIPKQGFFTKHITVKGALEKTARSRSGSRDR